MATTKTPFATLDTSAHANETKQPSLRRTRSFLSYKKWRDDNKEEDETKDYCFDHLDEEWVDGKDLYRHATADELQDGDTIAALEEEGETDDEDNDDEEEEETKGMAG